MTGNPPVKAQFTMKKVFDKSTFPSHQPFKSSPLSAGGDENLPSSQSNIQTTPSQPASKSQGTQPEPSSTGTFNEQLKGRQPSPVTTTFSSAPLATRLDIIPNFHMQPRRHMYNKPSERAAAINERIERVARKWTESGVPCIFEDLAHPARAHPVIICSEECLCLIVYFRSQS